MPGEATGDGSFRRDLGRLVRRLLEESHQEGQPIAPVICRHLGEGAQGLPLISEELDSFDLANLQLALDAALDREGWSAHLLGVAGEGRRFSMLSLSDLMTSPHFGVGPPEYVNADIAPGRTLPCLDFGLLMIASPEGPLCVLVHRGEEQHHGPMAGLSVQAASPRRELAEAFLADIRRLMAERDVFRGQLIAVETTPYGGRRVVFLERPQMEPDELVLPDGLLDRVERHIVGPTVHREALRASGRHLGRGLLLWGPPGTGKTHTVRYLMGRLREATVIVLSGGSLGLAGAFGTMARRLAPAVVILEDVDLVAEERHFDGLGSSPVLFELMNQMSGLGEDADVAFVLTTNRPDALEPALAARPGRIDLAIEIPLPDAEARRRLIALYGRGLDLRLEDAEAVVARTEGVTASFIKELLRKAALGALDEGRETVVDADVRAALDELLSETASLTRTLLGSGGEGAAGSPTAWLESFPDPGV